LFVLSKWVSYFEAPFDIVLSLFFFFFGFLGDWVACFEFFELDFVFLSKWVS
jgi:hypothetical protein